MTALPNRTAGSRAMVPVHASREQARPRGIALAMALVAASTVTLCAGLAALPGAARAQQSAAFKVSLEVRKAMVIVLPNWSPRMDNMASVRQWAREIVMSGMDVPPRVFAGRDPVDMNGSMPGRNGRPGGRVDGPVANPGRPGAGPQGANASGPNAPGAKDEGKMTSPIVTLLFE